MIRRVVSALVMGSLLAVTACDSQVVLGALVLDPAASVPPSGTEMQATKVDLLFVIDNAPGMAEKQTLMAQAASDLVLRIASVPGVSLHVGVLSSSLGGRGASDFCGQSPLSGDPAAGGHLVTQANGNDVPEAAGRGFLAIGSFGVADAVGLASATATLVGGVGERGCVFSSPLEAAYRFLVQPDPYESVWAANDVASFVSVDGVLLQQRHDFLRPDSLVSVVALTDRNDASFDPIAMGGRGWSFAADPFPQSVSGDAPRGTSACPVDPTSAACASCLVALSCDQTTSSCGAVVTDPSCQADDGFYSATEDPFPLRFFHMKPRFGVNALYPIVRYVNGFTSARVPSRTGEHTGPPLIDTSDYAGDNDCANPLFSQHLPIDPSGDLCNLTPGPRSPSLVLYSVVAGIPDALIPPPGGDFSAALGIDPEHYRFAGIDPHMMESTTPRAGVPLATTDNAADPISGGEWATDGKELQYACIFDLPHAVDCTLPTAPATCACTGTEKSPLCASAFPTTQVRSKATPSPREIDLVRALGDQALLASVCAKKTSSALIADADYGYRPAIAKIGDRMMQALAP